MDAKTYAAAVALIMVGVGVGYVLMGPFPETTEAMSSDGGGGQYDPPHSSQVSFRNSNDTEYGPMQYLSFWKEGNNVTSDCISAGKEVIFYDYDMNVIAEYNVDNSAEGIIQGNETNKCINSNYFWIDTELPQEPVRVGFDSYYGIRTF